MIVNEDVINFCKNYKGEKFHTVLCDPPYHLTSPAYRNSNWKPDVSTSYGRSKLGKRGGFMGKEWDGGDIAFQSETWKTISEVMHDGAFGMAFSSTRTMHRMMFAIEDAGLLIHPCVAFLWVFGSGFPKATRIDTQINSEYKNIWLGHRYGMQALKPSWEPVIIFQKPYKGRPFENILKTGAGALNIDGCRVGDDIILTHDALAGNFAGGDIRESDTDEYREHIGRWPANLMVIGEEAKNMLDEQSGICGAYAPVKSGQNGITTGIYHDYKSRGDDGKTFYGERKYGASRFFYYVDEQIDSADPIYYCAKASRNEKEVGLDDIPEKCFGQSGGAQNAIEKGEEEYIQEDNIGLNRVKKVKNDHPTVKPIKLTEYLAKLLLPPSEYAPRRIFVPFAGVASEMIGCFKAGWEEVIGVEKEQEYCEIAKRRLEYWVKNNDKQMELEL